MSCHLLKSLSKLSFTAMFKRISQYSIFTRSFTDFSCLIAFLTSSLVIGGIFSDSTFRTFCSLSFLNVPVYFFSGKDERRILVQLSRVSISHLLDYLLSFLAILFLFLSMVFLLSTFTPYYFVVLIERGPFDIF